MTSPVRVAVAVATISLTSLVAGTAWAAPPQNYDQEAVGKLNAANSVETVRHLAVDIGPRRSATPEERAGAEYLKGVLESYGFTVRLIDVPFTGTRNTAKVTSPNATLPNGPYWQMSSSTTGKITGDAAPVQAPVVYVPNGGATPADFPADTSGKIVLMNQAGNTAGRTTQVANAVAAGAVAAILGNTATNAAPTTTITLNPAQPIPVLGAGRAHLDWINGLLAAGPLTLRLVTNSYVNHPRTVVEGIRHAVGDPTGTTAPIISIGAHIDSVLGAPGAHDDASGNGATMEMARVLSQYALDKEIRVGGYGGEEDGLVGAQYYVQNFLSPADRARYVGHWQMDMVATPYPPAEFWALVPNGTTNLVVNEAYAAAARSGFAGMQNCFLGQSDHQAYFDVGIPSSLFIWLNYRKPALPRTCTSGPFSPDYTTEPEYHRPTDGMNNISPERMQTSLNVVGGAAIHMALNKVTFTITNGSGQPVSGAKVTGDCGDGVRDLGESGAGGVAEVFVPHATCDFNVANGGAVGSANDVAVAGDRTVTLSLTGASTDVSGSVPATLALTVGPPASFGAFTPGVARDYFTSTSANVISTGGDALLSVADTSSTATGHLVNGTFSLPQPLQSRARNATTQGTAFNNVGSAASPLNLLAYGGPISNDAVTLDFKQAIGAADALRTGTYSKTLTFTLSTTAP
ncbi:MAG TPA: M28 family peptidase [Solirubrobacteraceae bacterium]|nr:M28 family peptidase [Solirubrobacteraceae bacterium]